MDKIKRKKIRSRHLQDPLKSRPHLHPGHLVEAQCQQCWCPHQYESYAALDKGVKECSELGRASEDYGTSKIAGQCGNTGNAASHR